MNKRNKKARSTSSKTPFNAYILCFKIYIFYVAVRHVAQSCNCDQHLNRTSQQTIISASNFERMFLNVPLENAIILRPQFQLTYCNVGGTFCAFVQLCLIAIHDYRKVLYVRETNYES